MRKIREILRLRYELKFSFAKIAKSCGVSETTASECVHRAIAAGLSWPLPQGLDDQALEALLYRSNGRPSAHQPVTPDWSYIHAELKKRSVTLQLLWSEYKQAHPGGYQYSQFCHRYRAFRKTLDYAFRNEHKAGEKLFVDYAGQTVPINDPRLGGVQHAQIFIAVLGASSYTYAEASWTQELSNWIASHVRAFQFFGGSTQIIVPDNLKSAVTRACRYDPDINPAYYHMADHYRCAVIPARPYKPKDKAKAEAGVLLVERWILAALRNRQFFALSELNAAISELLTRLNRRRFKKINKSREDLFEGIEKGALQALPSAPYDYVAFKLCRVGINYHVEIDAHSYSVPCALVQKQVEVRVSEQSVEVLFKNERVASHKRSHVKGGYTTLKEHMPTSHQKYASWTPERMIRWAGEAGEFSAEAAAAIMASKRHPEQGFKAVLGLLRLGETYGKERLNAACAHALKIGSPRYQTIKSLLKLGVDQRPLSNDGKEESLPEHGNIRGSTYYN